MPEIVFIVVNLYKPLIPQYNQLKTQNYWSDYEDALSVANELNTYNGYAIFKVQPVFKDDLCINL